VRGHIKQRTKGSWTIRVELPRDPVTNRRRQKTVTIRCTKKEAEAKLAQMLVDLGQGYHVDAENITVGQYLERWLNAVEGQPRANTFVTYSCAVKKFSALIGEILLRKLTSLDVQEAVNKLQRKGGIGAGSVKRYLTVLRLALEQAVEWDFISKNQARKVKSAKYEVPEIEFWIEEEANLFLEKSIKYRYHSLYWLALHSGMREGELLGLVWKDIELGSGFIHVCRTATRYGTNDPKSSAGKRTIPVDTDTIKMLKKHRKVVMEETLRRGDKWTADQIVFPTRTGKRLHATKCRDFFTNAIRNTGVKQITFHGLRHTYATILLHRGVPPEKVAEILGHADVATLMNTYAHCLPKDEQAVLKAISQAFQK